MEDPSRKRIKTRLTQCLIKLSLNSVMFLPAGTISRYGTRNTARREEAGERRSSIILEATRNTNIAYMARKLKAIIQPLLDSVLKLQIRQMVSFNLIGLPKTYRPQASNTRATLQFPAWALDPPPETFAIAWIVFAYLAIVLYGRQEESKWRKHLILLSVALCVIESFDTSPHGTVIRLGSLLPLFLACAITLSTMIERLAAPDSKEKEGKDRRSKSSLDCPELSGPRSKF